MGNLREYLRGREKVALAATLLLVLAFVFGGASRAHALRLAVVELAALPLLILTVQVWANPQEWKDRRLAMGVLAALAAIPLVQLVPLPPEIWTGLPGRETVRLALSVSEVDEGWLPASLTPDRTWQSFLALLPPIAMFTAILAGGSRLGRTTVAVLLVCTVATVSLGLLQLGSRSEILYPWATTDAGSVTGFFANRNHLATLCLVSLPFASVLAAAPLRSPQASRVRLWLGILFIVLIVGAIFAIRSRAGLIFLIPTLALSAFAAWRASGRKAFHPGLLAASAAVAIALGGLFGVALNPIVSRFDQTLEAEGRFERWPGIEATAEQYLPLGSGVGSFDAVYRSVEPLNLLGPRFFNQAHNDYLESWLETGWLGLALLIAFLIWFGRRVFMSWRPGASEDGDLKRAASIGILVVMAHSMAEYPLRTATIAVVFALCCGLLELPHRPIDEFRSRTRRRRRSAPDARAEADRI